MVLEVICIMRCAI